MKSITDLKLKIVTKIIREELDLTGSTIMPPIRDKTQKTGFFDLDTSDPIDHRHPVFRPYYTDFLLLRPVMTSYGHRPSSGSRTFVPATMKFRLKHGEIMKTDLEKKKTGFGLPVSVLAKLLRVPKQPKLENSSSESFYAETSQNPSIDDYDRLGHTKNGMNYGKNGNIGNGIFSQTGAGDW
jgi:hypothetical protein